MALAHDVATQHALPKLGESHRVVTIDDDLVEPTDHSRSPSEVIARPNVKNESRYGAASTDQS